MLKWFKVCRSDELKPGEARSITLLARPYGVFNVGGTYYGMDAGCQHMKANLAAGRMYGEIIQCVMHGWEYNVTTGECLTVENDPLRTFPVKVEDDHVWIGLEWPPA